MIKMSINQSVMVVQVFGELDMVQANEFNVQVDEMLLLYPNIKELLVDLTNVTFMDSTGLGALIGRYKMMKLRNGELSIVGADANVRKVLEMAGLKRLIRIASKYGGEDVQKDNYVKLTMNAQGENVALARLAVSGFLGRYDIGVDVLEEIKIALSEAVSNAVIHGYEGQENGMIEIVFCYAQGVFEMTIHDDGVGIADVKQAMTVAYSTKTDHMGLGFAFMGSFSDRLEVDSILGQGTTVRMRRALEETAVKSVV